MTEGKQVPNSEQVCFVTLEVEVRVKLPVEIPAELIDADGTLHGCRHHDAVVGAAGSWVDRHGEIDCSGYLGIPFHTWGPYSSMAEMSVEVLPNDCVVRIETVK